MARIKRTQLRDMKRDDLLARIRESRAQLAKLRVDGAKGTLRKESGKIRPLRRDIARMLTRLREAEA
ncbi:MAG: 50S ribosomal protein L29 [Nitrosopumilus sp.]|nr:50S ribosomal protein L29 [Nitrosopumilus sp.]MDA7944374.1 50S ribosomal protein L29 [Nitrosopumilus sp.]MDA7954126.1 50S ribosomal protein L29 [Nitrosopumilus sp.]MDA7973054.1 50S ribosomal protein L29 [Nitrosopumilus sp.]MDA7996516.1 50S ribosomal protein L29 [Nitrosopumilus sp.]